MPELPDVTTYVERIGALAGLKCRESAQAGRAKALRARQGGGEDQRPRGSQEHDSEGEQPGRSDLRKPGPQEADKVVDTGAHATDQEQNHQ